MGTHSHLVVIIHNAVGCWVVDQNLGHLVTLVVRPVDDHEPCIIVADDDGLSAYDDSFDVLNVCVCVCVSVCVSVCVCVGVCV